MSFDELTKQFVVIKLDFMVQCLNKGKTTHLLLLDLVTVQIDSVFMVCVLQTRQTSAIIKAMCRNKLSQLNAHTNGLS